MKLNRDVLIGSIIEHQHVFFRLLDHIDNNDGALEVPEQLYLYHYNNDICEHEDDAGQFHLSIPSLVDNGVFIHHDKSSGMITLERVIVDLLRFLDIKRAKELAHSDFEQMRSQLNGAVDFVIFQPLGSQFFTDGMSTFNNLMSEIHSKVKENVNALTAQVDSLASEYKLYSAGSTEIGVFDLYDKVSSLYHRFVLPCYEFIDPSMEMVKTQSFSKSVDRLIAFYSSDDINDTGIANKIQLRKTAISSYYKDLADLARKLEQFSNHLEKDRGHFLAIDDAYNKLMESIMPLRHGRKKNKYLTSRSDVFSGHIVLDGLTSQRSKFDAKLKWDKQTKLRFKSYQEFIATLELTDSKSNTKTLEPLPPNIKPDQDRQLVISKLLLSNGYNQNIDDLHQFIHSFLSSNLNDFQLADVLYGLETFLAIYTKSVDPSETLARHHLDDAHYFIEYAQLEYKAEKNHV